MAAAFVATAFLIVGTMIGGVMKVSAAASNVDALALEMDGNIARNATTPPPYDWADLFTSKCPSGTPSPISCPPGATPKSSVGPFFGTDFKADWNMNSDGTFNSFDDSTYATGSKDILGIGNGGWQCNAANNVGNKVDITNFYVTAQIDPSNQHLIAYFGLEKFGSNGTNDIGVWFLVDSTANCDASAGTTNWTGHHSNGDVLLTSEFTSGGTTSSVAAFVWSCPSATTGLQCDNQGTLVTGPKVGSVVTGVYNGTQCGSTTTTNQGLCAITNTSTLNDVPWLTAASAGVGHSVPTVQFYEGAADLTQIVGAPCVGRAVADTRSSATPTATLFDFASEPFNACGELKVHKYIDVNGDGTDSLPSTPDVNGSGWTFTVKNSANETVCTGTTGTDGLLTCTTGSLKNLPTGQYTVTETQKTGYYNTDPGNTTSGAAFPHINTGATGETALSKTVTVSAGGSPTVDFGNDCFRTFTPTVSGLTPPSGQSVKVDWSVNTGSYNAGATGTLTLAQSGANYTATSGAVFTRGDTITWKYYLSGDTTNKVTANSSLAMSGGTYSGCNVPDSATFAPPNIDGYKYKDNPPFGDGATPGTEDTVAAGFTFKLYSGNTATGTPVQTVQSGSDGKFLFTSVAPGTYTIHEDLSNNAGWLQTYPVNSSGVAIDKTVTIDLGDNNTTIHEGNWMDTPLSHFSITVTSEGVMPGTTTAATQAGTITCDLTGESTTGNTYSSGNGLKEGTYNCTVEIIDP